VINTITLNIGLWISFKMWTNVIIP